MITKGRYNVFMNIIHHIPNRSLSRKTLFIDESGVASLKDSSNYFIMTAVISTNEEFNKMQSYYIHLKQKFNGYSPPIHATDLFREKGFNYVNKSRSNLLRIGKVRGRYIKELAQFIDTIPFVYITCVIDKRSLLNTSEVVALRNPLKTTFKKAISVCKESSIEIEEFKNLSIQDVLKILGEYKIKNQNNYKPLEIAYIELLRKYNDDYIRNFCYENTNKDQYKGTSFELCFETSSNRTRLINLTDKILSGYNGDEFRENMTKRLYCLSFANKSAKYLGVEIADLISYGYSLRYRRVLGKNKLYSPLWKVIKKREKELIKNKNFNPVIEIKGGLY